MDKPVELPDKLFFKIGEVSRLVGVEPYVLRYWESEFRHVRPNKSRGGQRMYRRKDVESLLRIKRLLKDEGFTIAGARKRLAAERQGGGEPEAAPDGGAPAAEVDRLVAEIARLKGELTAAEAALSQARRRANAREDTLRALRKEASALLAALAARGRD